MRAVSAIVPAAGLSKRMGGPNKLLLPWEQTTVIGAVVRILLMCSLDVVVVTGRDAAEVAGAALPARSVFNRRYEDGIGTSIAAGVLACPNADAFLIALGDMPDLDPDVIRTLLAAAAEADQNAIIAPVYADEPDRPGHPVLFGGGYRQQLLQLQGDRGARQVWERHRNALILLPAAGGLIDRDHP